MSLNALKRRRRFLSRYVEGDLADTVGVESGAGPADRVESQEIRETVRSAIDRLAPKQKAVVTLRLIDGYSTRETAEILGVPEGTVLSRLSRALKRLQPHLQPLMET